MFAGPVEEKLNWATLVQSTRHTGADMAKSIGLTHEVLREAEPDRCPIIHVAGK
jgi:hypothetical protein